MYSQIKALDYAEIADFSINPVFEQLIVYAFAYSVVLRLLLVGPVEQHYLGCFLQIEQLVLVLIQIENTKD
jgi:hypothetical protein